MGKNLQRELLQNLPNDIIPNIVSFLPSDEGIPLSSSSKYFRTALVPKFAALRIQQLMRIISFAYTPRNEIRIKINIDINEIRSADTIINIQSQFISKIEKAFKSVVFDKHFGTCSGNGVNLKKSLQQKQV